MKCAFLGTKIAASFETAKRIMLKVVKGSEKVRSKGYGPLFHSKQNSLPGLRYARARLVMSLRSMMIMFAMLSFNQ